MDVVSTIMINTHPDGASQEDTGGVFPIEESDFDALLDALLDAEPDHGALVASLLANDERAEEGVDRENEDKENDYLNELVDAFVETGELSHLASQSPPSLEKVSPSCPAMHRHRPLREVSHQGMTTRAASVLASIEKAPDTGDRVMVKRCYEDVGALPFGKRSKH